MKQESLLALAASTLGPLEDGEVHLIGSIDAGKNFVGHGDNIRPHLLAWAITDPAASSYLRRRGLRAQNLRISGDLDLTGAETPFVIALHSCKIAGDLLFEDASLATVSLAGTSCQALIASRSTFTGSLLLRRSGDRRFATRTLILRGARIAGSVDISGAQIDNSRSQSWALDTSRASIEGSLIGSSDTQVRGGFIAVEMKVTGNLSAIGAKITAEHGATSLDSSEIDTLSGKISPDEPIRQVSSSQWALTHALMLTRARISGSLLFNTMEGEAEPQTMILGRVFLEDIEVEGDVDFSGSYVETPEERSPRDHALTAEADSAVESTKTLDLSRAAVRGAVSFERCHIKGHGISMRHARIGRGLFLDDAFLTTHNEPDTEEQPSSLIVGSSSSDRSRSFLLEVTDTRIEGPLHWGRALVPDDAWVDLSRSSAERFYYAAPNYWPDPKAGGRLWLNDFSYSRIDSNSVPCRWQRLMPLRSRLVGEDEVSGLRSLLDRILCPADQTHLVWLRRFTSAAFTPQPYDQLASALRASGYEGEATRVLIAKENDSKRARGLFARIRSLPYRILVGSGFRPARALLWAVSLVLVGAVIFGDAYDAGSLRRTAASAEAQPFNPFVYSADVLFPIVDLHQEASYEANGDESELVRIYLWFQIAAGWLLALALTAAAGTAVQRRGR